MRQDMTDQNNQPLDREKDLEGLLQRAQDEIASLNDALDKRTREAALKETQLAAASAQAQQLSALYNDEHRRSAQIKSDLNNRIRDIATLTDLLREQEAATNSAVAIGDWACEVLVTLAQSPWWWKFLPRAARRRREFGKLKQAGLFDAAAYVQRYPDVGICGLHPLHHFASHGRAEGRTLVR